MELDQARSLLEAEQAQVRRQLAELGVDQTADRESDDDPGDAGDQALSLTEEGVDDAIAAGLQDRLAAINRALQRVDDGTYGRSIRSGAVIPDERLEADPAAELTVEEAAAADR